MEGAASSRSPMWRSWPGWPGRCSAPRSWWSARCRSPARAGRSRPQGDRRCAHPAGQPLIRVNTGAIARRVEQLSQVQSAQVSRDWPAKVVITVPAAHAGVRGAARRRLRAGGRFGVSIRDVAARPPGLPVLHRERPPPAPARQPGRAAAAAVLRRTAPCGSRRQVRSGSTRRPHRRCPCRLRDRSSSSGAAPAGDGQGEGTRGADARACPLLRRQRYGHRDGDRLTWRRTGGRAAGQRCGLRPSRLRRRVAVGARHDEQNSLQLARGELTLHPGNPTVRINRHHNITLNLRLRVRVLTHGKSWNCLAAAAGAHFGGPRRRPIPGVSGSAGRQVAKAGTR